MLSKLSKSLMFQTPKPTFYMYLHAQTHEINAGANHIYMYYTP